MLKDIINTVVMISKWLAILPVLILLRDDPDTDKLPLPPPLVYQYIYNTEMFSDANHHWFGPACAV